jgi:hypothetical protein
VIGFDALSDNTISEVAIISIDISGHSEEQVFLYIVPRLVSYDMILGIL